MMTPEIESGERTLASAQETLATRLRVLEAHDRQMTDVGGQLARLDELIEVQPKDVLALENLRRKQRRLEGERAEIEASVAASRFEAVAAQRDLARVQVRELRAQIEELKAALGNSVENFERTTREMIATLRALEVEADRCTPTEDRRQLTEAERRWGASTGGPHEGDCWTDGTPPEDTRRFLNWLGLAARRYADKGSSTRAESPPLADEQDADELGVVELEANPQVEE